MKLISFNTTIKMLLNLPVTGEQVNPKLILFNTFSYHWWDTASVPQAYAITCNVCIGASRWIKFGGLVIKRIINSLAPARCESNLSSNLQIQYKNWDLEHFLWNCFWVSIREPFRWQVTIGTGNNLVASVKIHHLDQCWSRSISPYRVTQLQGEWRNRFDEREI